MKKLLLTLRDIIVILIAVVLAQIIGGANVSSLMKNHLYTLIKVDLISPFVYGAVFYLFFWWLKKKFFKAEFPAINFPPRFRGRYFIYAFSLIILIAIGYSIIGVTVKYPSLNHYEFHQNLISMICADFLVAPFVEEIAFRGVILGQVAKRYNTWTGIIVSSLLFGLVHLMNGALNFTSAIQLVVSGTLMGCLLAVVYVHEHSIWADYTIHALYNLIETLLPAQVAITHDWPIQFIFNHHQQIITGGQYGADCSIINMVAYALVTLGVLYVAHRQHHFTR